MMDSPGNPVVLQAEGLTYRAGTGNALVADASATVRAGDMVAIAGPNGAGKSTLLRMLAGLLAPTKGSLHLCGRPFNAYAPLERARRIAYVGQLDEPDRRLTVYDYVALGRIPHRARASRTEDRRIVEEAIADLRLTGKELSPLGQISGGELQRASVARALCQQPDVLFLDEPTNHLDPKAKGTLLSLLCARGITSLCVLHELALIPKLASHTLLMNRGQVVAAGRTADVLTAQAVHQVFGVDFLHLAHPTEDRVVSVLDIPVGSSHSASN
ncbi:ABC transporter ATP-binding protein [Pelagibius sp.]|uniref:ABC transporter ATP-binding protein n=1 Tax=Pelagibius sp. TaxID=1931238 RepID=UPI002636C4DC|nr:ABC transporter ATP-binding protein [Pelagibius sp.]